MLAFLCNFVVISSQKQLDEKLPSSFQIYVESIVFYNVRVLIHAGTFVRVAL